MATAVFGISAPQFDDLPTQSETGLVSALNTLLAPLLTSLFTGFTFMAKDSQRAPGYDLKVIAEYTSGQTAIATPYLTKGFYAVNAEDLATQVTAFIALNPTYWYSQIFAVELDEPRRGPKLAGLLVYNTVLASGQQNWGLISSGASGGGGAPTGPAGGDLGGTYPNPTVFVGQLTAAPGATLTTLDTAAIASFKGMLWYVEAIKGTNTYTALINAAHDGTTAAHTEQTSVLQPASGTFDITFSVAVSGANMLLQVTPATTGWSFRVRRISQLAP